MFDIGFFELLIVFVVGLLILGPERLPHAAKTAGLWIRKVRRAMHSVQREINMQLDQEELQRKLLENNQQIMRGSENDNAQQENGNAQQESSQTDTQDVIQNTITPLSENIMEHFPELENKEKNKNTDMAEIKVDTNSTQDKKASSTND
ncbi:twin-arginine translocase subunit TatB [Marinomonas agarivorans]|nr:twin-arginine translocase subunit TatB [Marinomonas agarivorans]